MTREEIEYNARNCARMMYDTTLEREAYEKGYIKGVNDVQNPWISVEDRLPEKSVGYFSLWVLCRYKRGSRIYYHVGMYDYEFDEWSISNVTHWMPIPELKITKQLEQ